MRIRWLIALWLVWGCVGLRAVRVLVSLDDVVIQLCYIMQESFLKHHVHGCCLLVGFVLVSRIVVGRSFCCCLDLEIFPVEVVSRHLPVGVRRVTNLKLFETQRQPRKTLGTASKWYREIRRITVFFRNRSSLSWCGMQLVQSLIKSTQTSLILQVQRNSSPNLGSCQSSINCIVIFVTFVNIFRQFKLWWHTINQ